MAANDKPRPLDGAPQTENGEALALAWQSQIPVECLAYIGIALLSLWLRVTLLDATPISELEARQALHAWQTLGHDAAGGFTVSSSPLTYLTQLLTFSLAGADEFTARIVTALAGFALGMTPLLFRDSLGRTRAFVWACLLSFLTVPLAASRYADGASFMLLFAMLAVWMIRRYWYSQRVSDAGWAIVFVTFMLLLSSPAGIPLLIVLIAAGWLAVWRTALSAPQRLDLPGDDILQLAVKQLRAFPFAATLAFPFALVFACATLFMLDPAGLRTVAALLDQAAAGATQSASLAGIRLGFAALVLQEPLLIIFALGGAWLLWRHGDVTYVDRFAAAWAALGALALLIYPGARPADALWVVAPLSLLASYGIAQLMVDRRIVVLWQGADEPADNAEEAEDEAGATLYTTQYWWAKWAISLAALLCLLIISVQFMQVARMLADLPAGSGLGDILALAEASHLRLLQALGLLLVTAIICLVIFLLVASSWGYGTSLQGLGLGFVWLLALSGPGGAWQAAVSEPDQPDGLWRETAVTREAYLLRETLFELAKRETAGFPLLDITIVTERGGSFDGRGLLAWLTRDFPNARHVAFAGAAAGERIVIMRDEAELAAQLAGDYVGQRFVTRRSWTLADMPVWDWAAWWSQGHIDAARINEEALMLWLRQDVYAGAGPALMDSQ